MAEQIISRSLSQQVIKCELLHEAKEPSRSDAALGPGLLPVGCSWNLSAEIGTFFNRLTRESHQGSCQGLEPGQRDGMRPRNVVDAVHLLQFSTDRRIIYV